jgi:hypothetical protein
VKFCKSAASQAAKKLNIGGVFRSFVTGLDFSRADKPERTIVGLYRLRKNSVRREARVSTPA